MAVGGADELWERLGRPAEMVEPRMVGVRVGSAGERGGVAEGGREGGRARVSSPSPLPVFTSVFAAAAAAAAAEAEPDAHTPTLFLPDRTAPCGRRRAVGWLRGSVVTGETARG